MSGREFQYATLRIKTASGMDLEVDRELVRSNEDFADAAMRVVKAFLTFAIFAPGDSLYIDEDYEWSYDEQLEMG